MRRLVLFALALNFAVLVTAASGQRPNRVPIVGVLTGAAGPDDPIVEALRQGLRELGYVEGNNIRIDFRTAQGDPDQLPGLGEELVLLRRDAIVATSTLAAQAVKRATSTIPIVMALAADPVRSGLVASLAHPGGNVTGLSLMTTELSVKRLQLLKEAIPPSRAGGSPLESRHAPSRPIYLSSKSRSTNSSYTFAWHVSLGSRCQRTCGCVHLASPSPSQSCSAPRRRSLDRAAFGPYRGGREGQLP